MSGRHFQKGGEGWPIIRIFCYLYLFMKEIMTFTKEVENVAESSCSFPTGSRNPINPIFCVPIIHLNVLVIHLIIHYLK